MSTVGYPYTLPTAANVSFQEFLVPNAQYQRPLSDATAFRGRLRAALKEHKHSDRHDFLNIQKALEEYIPLMSGLVAGIESTELRLINDVETTWRCTMSNIALSSKQPRVKQKSIYYEAIFTFLTLGYVFMDRANECTQAVQRKIQLAIGDESTYVGGYGDGSSLVGTGIGHTNSSSGHHGVRSGFGSSGDIGHGSGGGGGGTGISVLKSKHGAATRLFKKGLSSASSKSSKSSNMIGEFTDYLSDEDLAGIDHRLTMAADLYCRAAGVFEYVVQEMIPKWNDAAIVAGEDKESKKAVSEMSRPIDIQTSVVSAHIRLALGEAHACTVRKATIKAARASAIKNATLGGSSAASTAGLGATGSKTSYVLLAKLTIGIKEEYERAYGLLKSVKDLNDISTEFRAHVKDAKVYYEAVAQTLLGMDAYEAQHYGKAIGFMSLARISFASLAKSSKAHTIAQAAAFECRLATENVVAFEKINNSVTFEVIPPQSALLAVIPSGRIVLQSKKYLPPKPSFGTSPTTADGSQSGADDSVQKLSYALQGAYF
ncbi:hypothetical protein BG011_003917 [Mortierella polycephala]|uniref:pH-response regulator protein palC n=1 Tax=Mortierella polycephala TaxID=41804 RepID=A0A9P6Q179_9FUNG|nr:hypothetical protein BG011_003917 [Mortierella polycephala]